MSTIIPMTETKLPADCYVFKHSTACPISAAAADEVRASTWDRDLYWVNVIEQRPISNWIEQQYAVRHESPQLLSIRAGKVLSVLNHRAIEKNAFQAFQVAGAS